MALSIFHTDAHASETSAIHLRGSNIAKPMAWRAIWGTVATTDGFVALDGGFYPKHNDFLLYTGLFAGVGEFVVAAVSLPLDMLGNDKILTLPQKTA